MFTLGSYSFDDEDLPTQSNFDNRSYDDHNGYLENEAYRELLYTKEYAEYNLIEIDIQALDLSLRGIGIMMTSMFGIVSNIFNIVVFGRQGFLSHSTIVSFSCLALFDMLYSCLNVYGAALTYIEIFAPIKSWSWNVWHFDSYITDYIMSTLVYIACWITAYITIEKAVCVVVLPSTEKPTLNPKVALMFNIGISALTLFLHIPCMFDRVLKWLPHPYLPNESWLALDRSDIPVKLVKGCQELAVPMLGGPLILVILSNAVIVWKIKLSSKVRKQGLPASSTKKNKDEDKDTQKTNQFTRGKKVKLILAISISFVACFACVLPFEIISGRAISRNGYYNFEKANGVIFYVTTFLQCVNSGVKIFLYYHLSSQYKRHFRDLFKCGSYED